MDLVDEHDGAVSHAAVFFGVRHHDFDFLDAAQHGAEGDELAAGQLRDEPRQGRLADTRRPPEDNRSQRVGFDLAAQRLAGAEDMLLADEVLQALRTQAVG